MEQLRLTPSTPSEEDDGPTFLTIAEAARRVRCCDRTIRRAIDTGALRAGKVARSRSGRGGFRIRVDDLDAWLYAEADDAA